MTALVATFFLPCLLLSMLIGLAVPVSRRANLIALAVAAGAAALAGLALPDVLRSAALVRAILEVAGEVGMAAGAFVVAWTVVRLLIGMLAALFSRQAATRRRRGIYGPPHGLSGWLCLVVLALILEPLIFADAIRAALTDSWSPAPDSVAPGASIEDVASPAFLWLGLGARAVMLAFSFYVMRTLIRRTKSFRRAASLFLAVSLVTNTLSFAFAIATLSAEVELTVISCIPFGAYFFLNAASLAYVWRSRRIRATFTADPRTAPGVLAVLWRALHILILPSNWTRLAFRAWRGETPLAVGPGLFPFAIAGYLLAQVSAGSLPASIAASIAFSLLFALLGIGTWRAAERVRRTYRFGTPALIVAALPIVASAALVSNEHVVDLLAPGHASVAHGTVLRIEGGIGHGVLGDVRRLLRENPAIERVELDSPGGRGRISRSLASMVRERRLTTRAIGDCESACALIFLAGRERELDPGGGLGFHSPSAFGFSMSFESDDEYLEELRRVGATAEFIARVRETPSNRMWYPTLAELIASGILTQRGEGQPTEAREAERGA